MKEVFNIDKIEKEFGDLQQYSETQYKTIEQLQEKIVQLQSQNESLRIMLEQNLPTLDFKIGDIISGVSKEQLICEYQINLLHEKAALQEMTLEESRKFQIFAQVLKDIKSNGTDPSELSVKRMSEAELLKLVQN